MKTGMIIFEPSFGYYRNSTTITRDDGSFFISHTFTSCKENAFNFNSTTAAIEICKQLYNSGFNKIFIGKNKY